MVVGHETESRPLETRTGADQVVPFQVTMSPSKSTAAQNVAVGQEMDGPALTTRLALST